MTASDEFREDLFSCSDDDSSSDSEQGDDPAAEGNDAINSALQSNPYPVGSFVDNVQDFRLEDGFRSKEPYFFGVLSMAGLLALHITSFW